MSLHGNTTLENLDLSDNKIEEVEALTTALASTHLKHLGLGREVDKLLSNAQDKHKEVSEQVIEVLEPLIPPHTLDVMVLEYMGHLLDMRSELAGDTPPDDAPRE